MSMAPGDLKNGIKSLMKKRGRTQEDLAEHLKVSLPTVKRILGPEELGLSRLLEICEWLNVDLGDLEGLSRLEAKRSPGKFTAEQDAFFAENQNYLSYLAHLHSGESPEKIAKDYGLTARSTELYLIRLEKQGLLHRDAKGRVRLAHRDFPDYIGEGKMIRAQYRGLIERFSAFFTRRFAEGLGKDAPGQSQHSATMSMFSGRLSKKTAKLWVEQLGQAISQLQRQASLEEKLDVIEDECYFVLDYKACTLAPDDREVAGLKESLGRITNL